MEPRKTVQMNQSAGQKLTHTCTEQTYGHQGGNVAGALGCRGGMNWEIGIDMYTLICIKWISNKNLLFKKIKLNLKKRRSRGNRKKKKIEANKKYIYLEQGHRIRYWHNYT